MRKIAESIHMVNDRVFDTFKADFLYWRDYTQDMKLVSLAEIIN